MKILKYLLNAILISSICFIFSPTEAIAKTIASSEKLNKQADITAKTDVNMLVHPKFNCDPKMLVKGNPNIDPGILLDNKH